MLTPLGSRGRNLRCPFSFCLLPAAAESRRRAERPGEGGFSRRFAAQVDAPVVSPLGRPGRLGSAPPGEPGRARAELPGLPLLVRGCGGAEEGSSERHP